MVLTKPLGHFFTSAVFIKLWYRDSSKKIKKKHTFSEIFYIKNLRISIFDKITKI